MQSVEGSRKRLSKKDVATKYGVPRNTVSPWVRNKQKLTASLEKMGMNSSRKNKHCGNFEKVDKAIYNWFIGLLGVTEFKASDCWLNNGEKRYNHSISIYFAYYYLQHILCAKNL